MFLFAQINVENITLHEGDNLTCENFNLYIQNALNLEITRIAFFFLRKLYYLKNVYIYFYHIKISISTKYNQLNDLIN